MKKNPTVYIHISLFIITVISVIVSHLTLPRVMTVTFKSKNKENISIIDQQVRIAFSRPMDQKITSTAFSIEPTVKGNISWVNNTLYFTPLAPLQYDQTYTVTVSQSATDIYHKSFSQSFKKTFHTRGAYFSYLGNDSYLHGGDLNGAIQTITQEKDILDYQIRNGSIVYIQKGQGDTNQVYFYDAATNKSTQVLNDTKGSYSQIQLSPDGSIIYALPQVSPDQLYISHSFIYSPISINNFTPEQSGMILTQNIQDIETSKLFAGISRFWMLPDSNTLLLKDHNDEFFFHTLADNSDALLGKYIDFGGANGKADKLVFSTYGGTGGPIIVMYDGENKQISNQKENAVLPNINYEGNLVCYSFQNVSESDQRLSVKVVDISSEKTVLEKSDDTRSLERCKISPDSRYIAFETYEVSQHAISPYTMNPNTNEHPVVKILDLSTGDIWPLSIEGGSFQWIE